MYSSGVQRSCRGILIRPKKRRTAPVMPSWKRHGGEIGGQRRCFRVRGGRDSDGKEIVPTMMERRDQGFVLSSLRSRQVLVDVGESVLQHGEKQRHDGKEMTVVLPLVLPKTDGMPFALGIELYGVLEPGMEWGDSHRKGNCIEKMEVEASGMFELRFVLDGEGRVVRTESGINERLQTGDALVNRSGTGMRVQSCAKHGGEMERSDGDQSQGGIDWSMACLVAYVPVALVEQLQHHDDSEDDSSIGMAKMDKDDVYNINVGSMQDETFLKEMKERCHMFVQQRWRQARKTGQEYTQTQNGEPNDPGIPVSHVIQEEDMKRMLSGTWMHREDVVEEKEHIFGGDRIGKSMLSSWIIATGKRLQKVIESLAVQRSHGSSKFRIIKQKISDASIFRLPNQTNRLALVFDPHAHTPMPFVFGIEIFEKRHKTSPHVHPNAYELFFILSGEGEGFCGNERFPVHPGDVAVFAPGSVHGIDNGEFHRMYCVEIMLPDENFAEFVRRGNLVERLGDDDMCILTRVGCS